MTIFTDEQKKEQERTLDIFVGAMFPQVETIFDRHYLRGLFYDFRDLIVEQLVKGEKT